MKLNPGATDNTSPAKAVPTVPNVAQLTLEMSSLHRSLMKKNNEIKQAMQGTSQKIRATIISISLR